MIRISGSCFLALLVVVCGVAGSVEAESPRPSVAIVSAETFDTGVAPPSRPWDGFDGPCALRPAVPSAGVLDADSGRTVLAHTAGEHLCVAVSAGTDRFHRYSFPTAVALSSGLRLGLLGQDYAIRSAAGSGPAWILERSAMLSGAEALRAELTLPAQARLRRGPAPSNFHVEESSSGRSWLVAMNWAEGRAHVSGPQQAGMPVVHPSTRPAEAPVPSAALTTIRVGRVAEAPVARYESADADGIRPAETPGPLAAEEKEKEKEKDRKPDTGKKAPWMRREDGGGVAPEQFPRRAPWQVAVSPAAIDAVVVPTRLTSPPVAYAPQPLAPAESSITAFEVPKPKKPKPRSMGWVDLALPLPSNDPSTGDPARRDKEQPGTGPIEATDEPAALTPPPSVTFGALDMPANSGETGGFLLIPPDPSGAVGATHVVNVANVSIEFHTKAGVLTFRDSLADFFAPLGPLTFTFDPKVIYDQYEDRFVVVTMERTDVANGDAADTSRLMLAVSDDGDPSGTWYMTEIDSAEMIGGFDHWADYPGFAVDGEAVYITGNMFRFLSDGGNYGGVRLWVVDKGAVGGLYAGSTASVAVADPYAGGGIATTTQPAHTFGTTPVGVGTWLMSYSGLSNGTEFVQWVRVDDPLGAIGFVQGFTALGDIESLAGGLPDASQSGTAVGVETNDRRALHAVWREGGDLYLSTTVDPLPALDPANTGQATAYWVHLDTTFGPTVVQQGTVGGEELGVGTHTFMASIAVNVHDQVVVGFAASGPSIFPSSAYATRNVDDPPGTMGPAVLLSAGLDFYERTFCPGAAPGSNRWGDYSGAAVDPADQCLWVYNQHAMTQGSTTAAPCAVGGTESGRWATAYGKVCPPMCGNTVVEAGEECDDGNVTPGDGCDEFCLDETGTTCGDGTPEGDEECDDGNTVDDDGCDGLCRTECAPGFQGPDGLLPCDPCGADEFNPDFGQPACQACAPLETPGPGQTECLPDCDDNEVPDQAETDTDGDGTIDACDSDDDNDGVEDGSDSDPLDPAICGDADLDSCDDCSVGMDGFGPLPDGDVGDDGLDTDADGQCDDGDADDDNDGVDDTGDSSPGNPDVCRDTDNDGCDDCAVGDDDLGPNPDFDPANDGQDTDSDGLCDSGDADDDNDGLGDPVDDDPLDPFVCGDLDGDSCDDCAVGVDGFGPQPDVDPANDGDDADGDGVCDDGDPDDDNDGVEDPADDDPLDPDVCGDVDGDSCDDCSVGDDDFGPNPDANPADDGADTDSDGLCDVGDTDDDNDGVDDDDDTFPRDPDQCRDADADGCDDCAVGTDDFGPLSDEDAANDGVDTDSDGLCDTGDPDDDNDGVDDGSDPDSLDPATCGDGDEDGCDDCAVGVDGFGPATDADPANDGTDTDGDGSCDTGDGDDDNDGVLDGDDTDSLDPAVCGDTDADGCDDCVVGTDGFGPLPDADPAGDGTDTDSDGTCDDGDADDDNDGVLDDDDADSLDPAICRDIDADGCDDCAVGTDQFGPLSDHDPLNDGDDVDGDGVCDDGDADDDNDGVEDAADDDPLDPDVCGDADGDSCDDCSVGSDDFGPASDVDPANDGTDTDSDGLCDAGDTDDDNDGVDDNDDAFPGDPDQCRDADGDSCDDCAVGTDDLGPLSDADPANDGVDTDSDGLCDAGDADDDNDGVDDTGDSDPLDPDLCGDSDADQCDDCAVGSDDFGPASDFDPANDGVDTDGDGACDAGDTTTTTTASPISTISTTRDPNVCRDSDADSCDDCTSGTFNPANDGPDGDSDGACDAGDPDDDNDGVDDAADADPDAADLCEDLDRPAATTATPATTAAPRRHNDPAADGPDTTATALATPAIPTTTTTASTTTSDERPAGSDRLCGHRRRRLR